MQRRGTLGSTQQEGTPARAGQHLGGGGRGEGWTPRGQLGTRHAAGKDLTAVTKHPQNAAEDPKHGNTPGRSREGSSVQ